MSIFKKHRWSKWQHVDYFIGNYGNTYELLISKCGITGENKYKRVFVAHFLDGSFKAKLNKL